MKKVYILLAPGFEICEAMLPLDILRRAQVEVVTVSVDGEEVFPASNGTCVVADVLIQDCDFEDGDMLFLPGGMPGSKNLRNSERVREVIQQYHTQKKWLVAVCAAPMVFGQMGILKGEEATCFPGFEEDLKEAKFVKKMCVRSNHFITGCGAGACFALGREMVAALKGEEIADDVLRRMMFNVYP